MTMPGAWQKNKIQHHRYALFSALSELVKKKKEKSDIAKFFSRFCKFHWSAYAPFSLVFIFFSPRNNASREMLGRYNGKIKYFL